MLKRPLTEPARLSDLLDQMISMADGTGFPAWGLALKFRKDIHANRFAGGFAGSDAVCLQCFHDVRVVWPPQIQRDLVAAGDTGELGHRVFRILAGGAGQRGVFSGAAQDHAGSDHADRVCRIFGVVSEGAAGLESRTGVCVDRRRGGFYFSQMVKEFVVVRCARARASGRRSRYFAAGERNRSAGLSMSGSSASSPRVPVAIRNDAASRVAAVSAAATRATGVFIVTR